MTRFRLTTEEGSPLYIEVRIYRSRRLMRAAMRRWDRRDGVRDEWSDTIAVSRSCNSGMPYDRYPLTAVVAFPAHDISQGVVIHELTHAAIQWARRVRITGRAVWTCQNNMGEPSANERFAWMIGWLVAQFWAKRWRR